MARLQITPRCIAAVTGVVAPIPIHSPFRKAIWHRPLPVSASRKPSGYANDSSYDIWFNQSSTTSGQPNGTEVMVWINHQGAPAASRIPTKLQRRPSMVPAGKCGEGTGNSSGTSWNIVSYVLSSPVKSVSNMDLLPFFNDSISRGKLQSS